MQDNRSIEIDVSVSFKQYLKLVILLSLRRLLPLILLIFGVIISAHYLNSTDKNTNWTVVITASFAVVILLMAFVVYRSAKRQFENTPVLLQRTKYLFTEDRIEVSGDSFNSTLGWNLLVKAREIGNFFLLYGTMSSAFLIPLESFASKATADEFRILLREKLGDKAKIKK